MNDKVIETLVSTIEELNQTIQMAVPFVKLVREINDDRDAKEWLGRHSEQSETQTAILKAFQQRGLSPIYLACILHRVLERMGAGDIARSLNLQYVASEVFEDLLAQKADPQVSLDRDYYRTHEALNHVAKAAGFDSAWVAPTGEPVIILERKHPTEQGKIQVSRLDLLVEESDALLRKDKS